MKTYTFYCLNLPKIICLFLLLITTHSFAQNDSSFFKRVLPKDTTKTLNMDAVYNRPFLQMSKMPVALGGYMEANSQYVNENGITEGVSFQMRRLTIFMSSTITKKIKFLSEIEFEDGAKEINIEFASMDIQLNTAVNLRGGILMNPIGAFNQNHDGPKWEFIDRPFSATQLLPATLSNVGFGAYGKFFKSDWTFGYEAYLTNGFDDKIISNTENKTFLPAAKANAERFEESFNGQPCYTFKTAINHQKWGEIGLSYMGSVYNAFQIDGVVLDKKRWINAFALDFNTTLPKLNTYINGEWTWIQIDVPDTYSQQFGKYQQGGYLDIVQPVLQKRILGWDKAVLNAACRLEYVDWNVGQFKETNDNISDDFFAIVPALSFRPSPQTVLRLNYRYHWQKDILGNPPALTAIWQFGISTYF